MQNDEIVKLLMDMKVELKESIARLEEKVDAMSTYKDKTEEAYILSKENEKRLNKLEDSNKWLFRTTVGAVITTIVSAFFAIMSKFKF